MRRAIVLSGGGARGAYEAGVLHFVLGELPKRLGFVPRFDVYSGTSVGAVHTCHLAAHGGRSRGGRAHARRGLAQHVVLDACTASVSATRSSFSKSLLGFVTGSASAAAEGKSRIHGLLNTAPLERLVVEGIPWRRLRRNRRAGRFIGGVRQHDGDRDRPHRHLRRSPRRSRCRPGPTTCCTSRAPARSGPSTRWPRRRSRSCSRRCAIGDTYYCDGSLRQQTPLAPALRLGSNRVLVVGLRHGRPPSLDDPLAAERIELIHSAGFLFGKVLNALLIDRLEYDLGQMRV